MDGSRPSMVQGDCGLRSRNGHFLRQQHLCDQVEAEMRNLSVKFDSGERLPPADEQPAAVPAGVEKNSSDQREKHGLFLTPQEAVESYSDVLTQLEKKEIMQFNQVYFVGQGAQKIKADDKHSWSRFCLEKLDGRYPVVERDHIAYRYEMIKPLGRGSFGTVVKAYDHKTKTYVALKAIRRDPLIRYDFAVHVEVNTLHYLRRDLNNLSNTVRMLDFFSFRGHMFIVLELLSFSLYELLKINKFRGLDLKLVHSFAVQIVQSLKVLHSLRIIHCDLKPENILLKEPTKTSIRIIDFGNSCRVEGTFQKYVQSRFYRAPEVVLRLPYDCAVDVWSLGCILCELATGVALFPGTDEFHQMALFMQLLGLPPKKLLISKESVRHFDPKGYPVYLQKNCADKPWRRQEPGSKTWPMALGNCQDADFVDFVQKCLQWDQCCRMTSHQALKHAWIRRSLHTKTISNTVEDDSANKVS